MSAGVWLILILIGMMVLWYHRASLNVWLITTVLALVLFCYFSEAHLVTKVIWCVLAGIIFTPLTIKPLRQRYISLPILTLFRKLMPPMSRTEREALEAGTVGWDGELFSGNPDWRQLLSRPVPSLSAKEQAFLDGPVQELCAMIDDWQICYGDRDMPSKVWDFLKAKRFFAMIIPEQYGGLEFSAYAHSQVIVKVNSRSVVAAVSLSVPNSLGPAELLLHYGTEEQKDYYLPRLACGDEIPCFALTSPEAGSDASSMPDYGVVCKQQFQGKETLGITLNFDKRYITLAPVATVLGLAFKLFDPDNLLGDETDLGITCALIPRDTAGLDIGRRHLPMNTPFQNGPVSGKDVFIPIDWIIGGQAMAGQGWRMLMECLAAGRAISLPSCAMGGSKMAVYVTGAYARIRKQFGIAIGQFEGIKLPLARIAAKTYMMDALRTFTASSIDLGEKPSVPSAITKYHATELGRQIGIDAQDILAGKAICLGPNNMVAAHYQATPISITVEGANILTRCLIIFGQGMVRCHPYIFKEMQASQMADKAAALTRFDDLLFKHLGFVSSNKVRAFIMGLTGARLVNTPANSGELTSYYQQATRFSAVLAFLVDVSSFVYGGDLKRREAVSARLGDIVSDLYMLTAVLKHYNDQGMQRDDLPLVHWSCQYFLHHIETCLDEFLTNFPKRAMAFGLRIIIFPWGRRVKAPSDRLSFKLADLILSPNASRDRLANGADVTPSPHNKVADMQRVLDICIAAEPLEKKLANALRDGKINGVTVPEKIQAAKDSELISADEAEQLLTAHNARMEIVAVDSFSQVELANLGTQLAEQQQHLHQQIEQQLAG